MSRLTTSTKEELAPLFPLRRKLVLIVVAMSVFAFVVYVPVAYKHSQIVLANQLTLRASTALEYLTRQGVPLTDPAAFKETVQTSTVGEHGYIFAINPDGAIITPHPQGFTRLNQELRWTDEVDAVRTGKTTALVSTYKDTRYFVTIPFNPYRLVSVIYEADFLGELFPLIVKSLVVALTFGAVFAVLAYFFIHDIVSPIRQLTYAAQTIARHRRLAPLRIASGDELEILADQITEMGCQIRDYEENLERKIEERTAQLKETNEELKEKSMVLERVLEDVKKVDEELARLNRTKSEFISMASHQLRTPLTAIKWYAKILANSGVKKLTPMQLRAYHQIVASNERMIDLVNALLNVSRIEMGTLAVEPAEIEVGAAIKQVTKDIWPLAQERGVKLQIGPFPRLPAVLDPKLLEVVVSNLLSNAVRYTPRNGQVAVSLSASKGRVILKVADTGYGIPASEQKRIFSKFFRASNILKHEPQGTGLGLYLTRAVVQMMRGTIRFSSRERRGTTFIVTLPKRGMRPQPGSKGLLPMT